MKRQKLNEPTTWRWAKERAQRVIDRVAPGTPVLRPRSCDKVNWSNDPHKIAAANLSQWWISASARRMPGIPLYSGSSVLAYSLKAVNQAKIKKRQKNKEIPIWSSSDLLWTAYMVPHIKALHCEGLPVSVLVVTHRLHRSTMGWHDNPNEDWDIDGIQVQIIVENPDRIAPLVRLWCARNGIETTDVRDGYCGMYFEIPPTRSLSPEKQHQLMMEQIFRNEAIRVRRSIIHRIKSSR